MSQSKRYPWLVVGLLWGVALLNYMDRQMLSTMRPSMKVDIAELQEATYFGYLMAIFLWIYGLMSPVAGLLADKLNRKYLIVGSLFVWSAVTLAMGYATHFDQLYVLRALMGVSEAIYIPAGLSLIADYHSNKTRSLAVGIHMTGLYTGQALGGFGATLAAQFSWKMAFWGMGWVGILYAGVLMLLLKEKRDEGIDAQEALRKHSSEAKLSPGVLKNLRSLFGNFSFWLMILYFAIPSLPGWGIKNWLPTLFSINLGIDMVQAGPLSTITIAISSFVGVITGGILSDRWAQRNSRGRVYVSAIGLLLTIPSLLFLGFGNSLYHVIAAALCFGFGFGLFDANNMPILCQVVTARQRATAYGVMNMMGVFAGAMVTNWLGRSTDAGNLGRDFAWLAGVVALAVIIQLLFLRPSSQTSDPSQRML